MAIGRTIFSDITPRTEGHTVRKLIERAIPYLVTEPYIEPYTIPNKQGRVAKWRRYLALTVATTPLAEGVTPPGQKLTYSDVQVVMEQYGDWVGITDVIEDTHEDPILNDTVENCSEQMAETREINRISVWKAGTSVMYAGDPTYTLRNQVATAISRADLVYVTRQIKDNKGREISKLMTSNRNYGTEPIAPAFFAFSDSDLDSYDLREKIKNMDMIKLVFERVDDLDSQYSNMVDVIIAAQRKNELVSYADLVEKGSPYFL